MSTVLNHCHSLRFKIQSLVNELLFLTQDRGWSSGVERTEGRHQEEGQRAVAERIRLHHNQSGHRSQEGDLVRSLVRIAAEGNVRLGKARER